LSLLRRADMILVLDDGRLVQTGTHSQIVRLPGPYREAAMLQLMDLEENETLVREPVSGRAA
jgi:ATP-binding cassette subfamily B protein